MISRSEAESQGWTFDVQADRCVVTGLDSMVVISSCPLFFALKNIVERNGETVTVTPELVSATTGEVFDDE